MATMPFGKYKGREIVTLPVDYVRFILRTPVYKARLGPVELKAACGVTEKVRSEKKLARLATKATEKHRQQYYKDICKYQKDTGFLPGLR